MLNSNLFQGSEVPHQPLPKVAYETARTSLLKLNFPENAILDDYSFSTKQHSFTTNALAFTHPIHRNPAEYAGFTLYNATNQLSDEEIVSILTASGAFFHLVHRDNRFAFWASTIRNGNPEPRPVESNIIYEQLYEVLSHYEVDLKPEKIINVKQGRDTFTLPIFRDIHSLQLSFWAADVTRKLLVEHFAQAVDVLRRHARQRHDTRAHDLPVTSLAIQLLGAVILGDTGVLGNNVRLHADEVPLNQLVATAYDRFNTYFEPDLFEKYWEAAEEAYRLLRLIRYAGFVPDMLSEIYTRAFSKAQQKKLGGYYTPLYLTRRIWENIPVEYLPPDQRYVADMTCGWGSFLIAGHERLSNLVDSPSSLLENLRGNDNEPFTAKLAGLGLLLSTSEDSWHVDYENALDWRWLNIKQPNIIVGNPPFGSQQNSSLTGEDGWYEEANKYFQYAIEKLAPNGYIAMLMPRSFTSSLASPSLRQELLEECDLAEIWELPTGVFSGATARTIVLFAQKKKNQLHLPVRIRTVQPRTLDYLKETGIFTFTASGLVTDQSKWSNPANSASASSKNAYIMDYHIILPEHKWRAIRSQCMNLQDCANIIKGASVGKPENRRWSEYSSPKKVLYLTGVKDVLKRPFFVDYSQAKVMVYPNDFEEPRKSRIPERDNEHILAGKKVVVVYDPDTTWGRRNKLAIIQEGYYVSDSFWVVAPRSLIQETQNITCEVLAAVLSWDVCNAWIIEHLKSPAIPKRAMKTIPFPKSLTGDDCNALTKAVLQLEAAARANQPVPEEANQTIDTILKRAYHLDDAIFEQLRKIKEWDEKPEITLDPQPDLNKADWFLSGIVDSVNAEQGTITLWLEGFGELQTVQIVPSMPGWMLRPGAALRTKIPVSYVKDGIIDPTNADWSIFRPQPYTYMSEEELLRELSNLLHEDDRNRVG